MSGAGEAIVGVLLAGGQSRRMGGGDKCLLELAGKPLLTHAMNRLTSQVDTLVLNANGDPDRFSAFNLPVVADPVEGFAGPLAGVHAGFTWAADNAPDARWIVTVATDTPFFPLDLVARLLEATDGEYPAIALASSNTRFHPVFGLWPTALKDDLESALEDGVRKVLHWTDRHKMVSADFADTDLGGASIDPFFNANMPEDMERAEGLLSEEANT